jgi:hypothetical protein
VDDSRRGRRDGQGGGEGGAENCTCRRELGGGKREIPVAFPRRWPSGIQEVRSDSRMRESAEATGPKDLAEAET